ncbi:MAG: regulatory protein GemA [Kiritimatiellia bacterium]
MPTKNDYAKIAIACKELGIDRKALLADRYGLKSAKDLTGPQLTDLYRHFRAFGWTIKTAKRPAGKKKEKNPNYIEVANGPAGLQQRLVLRLWNSLGYEMAKLHTRCSKQFGIDRFEWVTDSHDLHVLITDLQKRVERSDT